MQLDPKKIDWSDPKAFVSDYFTVHDALWLPTWGRLGNVADGLTDEIKANLVDLFNCMDWVQDFLGVKLNVHCAWRPKAYNSLPSIGGAPTSMHIVGKACDFDPTGMNCDKIRVTLVPKLAEWLMRMERRAGPWLHLDRKLVPAGGTRYFIP